MIDTNLNGSWCMMPVATKRWVEQSRPGDVQDIAEAVVYLAASSGKFITGELHGIAGGMLLWGEFWPAGKPGDFKVDPP